MRRAIARLALCAAAGVLVAAAGHRATRPTVRPAPAVAAATPSGPGDTKVNQFVSYNATSKTVTIALFAALNSAQGGFNFNGGSSGNQTITGTPGMESALRRPQRRRDPALGDPDH